MANLKELAKKAALYLTGVGESLWILRHIPVIGDKIPGSGHRELVLKNESTGDIVTVEVNHEGDLRAEGGDLQQGSYLIQETGEDVWITGSNGDFEVSDASMDVVQRALGEHGSGGVAGKIGGSGRSGGSGGGSGSSLLGLLLWPVTFIIGAFGNWKRLVLLVVIGALVFGGVFTGVGSALPVVGDYLSYGGTAAADRAVPALNSGPLEETYGQFREARARVFCLLKGPECLRQWRLNNTQRPGSDEVGQQFGLEIRRFEVGQGSQIDVSRYAADDSIPVSYSIYNTRHGLKGINARNVSFRLSMVDSRNSYCDTGWVPVRGYTIGKESSGDFSGNDIFPGTTAFEGFATLPGFNLKECGALQPGAGEYRTINLDVKYDYFSQASLQFRAMDVQHLLSNPNVKGPDGELDNSRTADTPVKAAVGVDSPVLFNSEQEEPRPFSMGATVNTDERGLKYRVRGLRVTKSRKTEIVEGGERKCSFTASGNTMVLHSPEDLLSPGSGEWFTSNNQPPIFGCKMQLKNPGTISPSGETLNMRVEANYTVAIQEPIDSFKIFNSRCSRINCPLLVTQQFAESNGGARRDGGTWKNQCMGVDANNGCTIVEGPEEDESWSDVEPLTGGQAANSIDDLVEEGEIAVNAWTLDHKTEQFRNRFGSGEKPVAFGIKEERLKNARQKFEGYAVVSTGKETGIVKLGDDDACEVSNWEDAGNYELVVSFKPHSSCSTSSSSGDTGSGGSITPGRAGSG